MMIIQIFYKNLYLVHHSNISDYYEVKIWFLLAVDLESSSPPHMEGLDALMEVRTY